MNTIDYSYVVVEGSNIRFYSPIDQSVVATIAFTDTLLDFATYRNVTYILVDTGSDVVLRYGAGAFTNSFVTALPRGASTYGLEVTGSEILVSADEELYVYTIDLSVVESLTYDGDVTFLAFSEDGAVLYSKSPTELILRISKDIKRNFNLTYPIMGAALHNGKMYLSEGSDITVYNYYGQKIESVNIGVPVRTLSVSTGDLVYASTYANNIVAVDFVGNQTKMVYQHSSDILGFGVDRHNKLTLIDDGNNLITGYMASDMRQINIAALTMFSRKSFRWEELNRDMQDGFKGFTFIGNISGLYGFYTQTGEYNSGAKTAADYVVTEHGQGIIVGENGKVIKFDNNGNQLDSITSPQVIDITTVSKYIVVLTRITNDSIYIYDNELTFQNKIDTTTTYEQVVGCGQFIAAISDYIIDIYHPLGGFIRTINLTTGGVNYSTGYKGRWGGSKLIVPIIDSSPPTTNRYILASVDILSGAVTFMHAVSDIPGPDISGFEVVSNTYFDLAENSGNKVLYIADDSSINSNHTTTLQSVSAIGATPYNGVFIIGQNSSGENRIVLADVDGVFDEYEYTPGYFNTDTTPINAHGKLTKHSVNEISDYFELYTQPGCKNIDMEFDVWFAFNRDTNKVMAYTSPGYNADLEMYSASSEYEFDTGDKISGNTYIQGSVIVSEVTAPSSAKYAKVTFFLENLVNSDSLCVTKLISFSWR